MRLCVASYKPVWRSREAPGGFATDGGFPYQMEAISSLFDATELIVCERPAPADSPGTRLPSRGVRVVALREPRGSDGARKLFLAGTAGYYLARIAAAVARADAVHAVVPGDFGMFGMLLALAMRKPLFARYCSSWPDTPQTTRSMRLCKQLMRRYAGGRNVMFATGLGDTPPDGPGGRMRWIFSSSLRAADLEALEGASRREGATIRLLYVGRLSEEKGLLNLLEALARLEKAEGAGRRVKGVVEDRPEPHTLHPIPYTLTLAGHGPQLGALRERAAALGFGDERVRFTGLLDRAGVQRELAAADLFVLPSLTEGFPKALVEAMAAGLPAVASGVGAIPMILGSEGAYGQVVPPGDVGALAEALAALGADLDRRAAIGDRARRRAREWTLEGWGQQIGAVLEEAWGVPLRSGVQAFRHSGVQAFGHSDRSD
jgi:hypothetical protein